MITITNVYTKDCYQLKHFPLKKLNILGQTNFNAIGNISVFV